jgi:hypothetical protein
MATSEISAIRDLIKVLNDGVKFYTDAKVELKGSGYENVFQEMIDVRQNALVRLQPLIYAREGEVEGGQTLGGALHKAYTDLLAAIKSNKSRSCFSRFHHRAQLHPYFNAGMPQPYALTKTQCSLTSNHSLGIHIAGLYNRCINQARKATVEESRWLFPSSPNPVKTRLVKNF